MTRAVWVALSSFGVLAGCFDVPEAMMDGTQDAEPDEMDVEGEPRACVGTTVLDGSAQGTGPTLVPAQSYDTAGKYICLELDTRQNLNAAHFAAWTRYEPSATSSFELSLLDANLVTVLSEGADVSSGVGSTFANLEYGIADRTYVGVKLRVRAKAGTADSEVRVYLFEPHE
jgi:hypothetical protein